MLFLRKENPTLERINGYPNGFSMEDFTNDTLNIKELPRFEEVTFSKMNPNYWKVQCVNLLLVFIIVLVTVFVGSQNDEKIASHATTIYLGSLVFFAAILSLLRLSFVKKGFAFRQHDVLFRYGIIATKTVIIPYNRIQHVSLHEGLLSRYFGLAKIEIFTAGGSSSDIEIPGILKHEAEAIKQLLMVKIQKEL